MGIVTKPPILDSTGQRIARALEHIGHIAPPVYGFEIDESGSIPDQMVTYTDDAIGMTPFTMDLATGVPNYGSWKDAFFMPRPCMLSYDGEVVYYLDPDDLTKKEDGTASDITDTTFAGNAMMEWPVIYQSITQDGDRIKIRISSEKIDSSFHAFANTARNGNITNFYTPIYNGAEVEGKLRSMSGQVIMKSKTAAQEETLAEGNGTGWTIEKMADRMLINNLLILIGKSLDTQTVFGSGYTSGGTADNFVLTGTLNDKGLFYGLSSTSTPVKVFGMENYWGQQWRRLVGWMKVSATQKIKVTWGTEDGSTATGYNFTGDGYVSISNATPSGTSGGYISKMKGTQYGLIPVEASGSSTTKYCDGLWFNNSVTTCAYVGGSSINGVACGASCAGLDSAAAFAVWSFGASPSYTKAA